jgi:beta-1,4-N-acetylglucosaminyltransferase
MADNQKVCFVTTGATAPFTGLIEAVLTPGCVDALSELGYTHLLIQYGTANDVFDRAASTARTHVGSQRQSQYLVIDGLDFNPHGLKEQFKLVQESKGLVISHAGTFGILQNLTQQLSDPQAPGRYWRPYDTTLPGGCRVVACLELLDNHQEELAVAMDRSNYLIRGNLE